LQSRLRHEHLTGDCHGGEAHPRNDRLQLGVPSSEILDRLHEEPAIDLVVMATHGRGGVARLVMGSVADKIVRAAPCPVLTLREHPLKGRDRQAAGAVVAGAGR